jgi:hypothetical protein
VLDLAAREATEVADDGAEFLLGHVQGDGAVAVDGAEGAQDEGLDLLVVGGRGLEADGAGAQDGRERLGVVDQDQAPAGLARFRVLVQAPDQIARGAERALIGEVRQQVEHDEHRRLGGLAEAVERAHGMLRLGLGFAAGHQAVADAADDVPDPDAQAQAHRRAADHPQRVVLLVGHDPDAGIGGREQGIQAGLVGHGCA